MNKINLKSTISLVMLALISTINASAKIRKKQKLEENSQVFESDIKQDKDNNFLTSQKIKGNWHRINKWKPYLTLAYSYPELFSTQTQSMSPYFEGQEDHGFVKDLSNFRNFRVGMGVRANQYFGLEAFYGSFSKNYSNANIIEEGNNYSGTVGMLDGKFINLSTAFYTPPIDLKYIDIEFGVTLGTAIMINGVKNIYNDVIFSGTTNDIIVGGNIDLANTDINNKLPQFIGGLTMSISYQKIFSLKGYVNVMPLNEPTENVNLVLMGGAAIDLYLI